MTPYCMNIIFTLYMGIMKNPSSWMTDADLGLMRSVSRCFPSSWPRDIAIKPFRMLVQRLETAMHTAQSKHRLSDMTADMPEISNADNAFVHEPNSSSTDATRSPGQMDATVAEGSQPVGGLENDLQYQDFFDFGMGGDAMNGYQLWPTDRDFGTS